MLESFVSVLLCDWFTLSGWPQSRTQSPQAPWSAVWSNGIEWNEMEFFPQKSGVPVVVRMLSFIKTEVNISREFGQSLDGNQKSTLIYFLARGL